MIRCLIGYHMDNNGYLKRLNLGTDMDGLFKQ